MTPGLCAVLYPLWLSQHNAGFGGGVEAGRILRSFKEAEAGSRATPQQREWPKAIESRASEALSGT